MKEDKNEDIDAIMFSENDMKRSQFHQRQYVDWMKKRKFQKVNKKYLYYPDEMRRNMEIKNVFLNIDKDGSRALDMNEIFDMFHKYNFNIKKEDLQRLFSTVDDDKDNALNWKEFKKCALDDKANTVFTGMMRKLRQDQESKDSNSQKLSYIPMSFGNMISFLSYCSSWDELHEAIDKNKGHIIDKYTLIQNLFKLTEEYQQHHQSMSIQNREKESRTINQNEDLKKIKSDLDLFFDKLMKEKIKNQQQKLSLILNQNKDIVQLPKTVPIKSQPDEKLNLFFTKSKFHTTQSCKQIQVQDKSVFQVALFRERDILAQNQNLRISKISEVHNKTNNQKTNDVIDQYSPKFKESLQTSSFTKIRGKNKNNKLEYPKNPKTLYRNSNSIPYNIAKDLKYFKTIDNKQLYNKMGHTFYTKYIQYPSYAIDLYAQNKYQSVQQSTKITSNNSEVQTSICSYKLKQKNIKSQTQTDLNIDNNQFFMSQNGVLFNIRNKPYQISHQNQARKFFGNYLNEEEQNIFKHQKSNSDVIINKK